MTAIVPNGRRMEDRMPRWRIIFSPQATSLLLVVAVVLLAFVTTETHRAATAANRQTVVNRTIITSQAASDRRAAMIAQEQAVGSARLAATSIAKILAAESARSGRSDAATARLIAVLQAQLLQALANLSAAVQAESRMLAEFIAQDRTEHNTTTNRVIYEPRPLPAPAPTPTLTVISGPPGHGGSTLGGTHPGKGKP